MLCLSHTTLAAKNWQLEMTFNAKETQEYLYNTNRLPSPAGKLSLTKTEYRYCHGYVDSICLCYLH